MSINLIRFLAAQKKRAQRYHTDALRYRGVVSVSYTHLTLPTMELV